MWPLSGVSVHGGSELRCRADLRRLSPNRTEFARPEFPGPRHPCLRARPSRSRRQLPNLSFTSDDAPPRVQGPAEHQQLIVYGPADLGITASEDLAIAHERLPVFFS
jgi:hypothetical protein